MKRLQLTLARTAMQLLCLLLGVILIGMVGVTGYVQYHISKMEQSDSVGVFSSLLSDQSGFSGSGEDPTERIGGTGSGLVNILLIGMDAREGETGSRSDSIILCTYHQSSHKLFLTSFLRDLYVPIPGFGSNRINAAYAYGGSALLQQTLEDNFRLHIDGEVEVDFGQFSEIIDLLGGVTVSLRQDEAQLISEETGTQIEAGTQTLDGQQALTYARIRKLDADGDFSRTSRQRTVMEAILNAYRNAGTGTILKLIYNLLPMIHTNMDAGQILALAVSVIPELSHLEIVSQHIPTAGTYSDQMIDGMAVLVPDLEAATENLRNSFK